ncbi:hypothetical protein [Rheinheimera gaetbuli]
MMLRKALVLGTACTMLLCSGAVFAQEPAQFDATNLTTQLAAAPQNAGQLIADAIAAANGDKSVIDAILAAAAEAGVDADTILTAAVGQGVDPTQVAQVVADTQTAAGPTSIAPAFGSVAPVSLPAPGAPGFGGGGGGGGGTVSGN